MATLLKQWQKLIGNQTKETFEEFWEEYSGAETKIYSDILDHPDEKMTGTIAELSEKYDVRPVIFMGFLDGVNESIVTPNDLEGMDEESQVEVEIIPEKLFFNMLKAEADYLYGLEQWNDVLDEEKMAQIAKEYKQSRTVRRATPKIGRNDPCPCGSGKKYKHCCGR